MNFYTEPEQQIPIKTEVDVIVVGSGPAGVAAAILAGRQGVKTLLIELTNSVGGVATTGLMSHWTGATKGGIYEEILSRSQSKTNLIKSIIQGVSINRKKIDPEVLKTVLLEMLDEANVELLLYTHAVKPIIENNLIKGIIIESKSGREAILGKIIIDASGDGDIAARAGVSFKKGRDEDEKMQPMTLMFKLAGVNLKKAVLPGSFESNYNIPKGKIQDLGKANIPYPAGHVLLYKSTLPGIVTVNMTNVIDVDGTKVEDLTKAEKVARKQIDPIIKFLHEFVPGFKKCYIISSASMIGVRETRHFEGEYTITAKDILHAREFEDWVVKDVHFNFDIHNIKGAGLDEHGSQAKFSQSKHYTIPYGCFIPKKIDNLFLAGRNISGTHIAHSNYRAMPICVKMGQAVGVAAAMCISQNILPRKLDVSALQSEILKIE
jgi:FAD-dependent oxidoreductase family protein